jgi:hypothetical protein
MSEDLLTHFLTRYNAFLADKLSTDIDQIKKISSTFLSTYEAPVITKPSVSAPVSTSKSVKQLSLLKSHDLLNPNGLLNCKRWNNKK